MPPTLKTREREIEEDDDGFVADSTKKKPEEDDDVGLGTLDDADDDNTIAKREQERDVEVEDDQDARLAYDLDADEAGGPQERDSRRKRRNRARRQAQEQSTQHIAALTNELTTLKGVVDQMSRGQVGLAASDLDSQIVAAQNNLEDIDNALARAVKEQDDVLYKRAMRLRDEAQSRLSQLGYSKRQLLAEAGDTRRQPEQRQTQQRSAAPDPVAVQYSNIFLSRHEWFDPTDGADQASNMVKAIDDTLTNEGFKPNTRRYWVELEKRVSAAGIGESNDGGDDVEDEQQEERPARRNTPRGPGGMPPRAGGGGGGRKPGAGGFRLDTHMQEALDAEGLLDEKSLTKEQKDLRRRYVTTWKAGFEKAAASNRR